MRGLRDHLLLLRDFFRTDFPKLLLWCAVTLAVGPLLGCAAAFAAPEESAALIDSFVRQIAEEGILDKAGNLSVFGLLLNNWRAMLFSAVYGLAPFLFLPVFTLLANGILLGVMGGIYWSQGLSAALFLAALLPHGIFEIPALLLSAACGVCLCRNMCRIVTGSQRRVPMVELAGDLLRVMLLLVFPLTVAAAVMEAYVTPLVAGLFQ